MSVVFLTGNHPRHAYMARQVAARGALSGLVVEAREEHVPEPPDNLGPATTQLFGRHFAERAEAEQCFFSSATDWPKAPTLHVDRDGLNSPETLRFINGQAPTLLLSYGVHKLGEAMLRAVEADQKWNIHGGLSPWYRGVITHFWPSYLLEPQMTGMTVHELTRDIDGGDVVHQAVAPLIPGDGVHQLACRAVLSLGEELPHLLERTMNRRLLPPRSHKTSGRIWRSSDWRPAHLHVVYEMYQNRIVDLQLRGELAGGMPNLVRQFE